MLTALFNDGKIYEVEYEAINVVAAKPSDDRVVILHDYDKLHGVIIVTARYRGGRWIETLFGNDLTDKLTDDAIWSEMLLGSEQTQRAH